MNDPLNDLNYPAETELGAELTVLPVSPHRLFATWAGAVNGRSAPGEHRNERARSLCLRIREIVDVDDADDAADRTNRKTAREWTLELGEAQSSCMIDLNAPGMTVRAELLPASANGAKPLARSRRVHMPASDAVDDGRATQWLICDRNGRRQPVE